MVMPTSNRKKLEQTCIKKIEVVGYKINIKIIRREKIDRIIIER